ncbi:MAG: NAD(P)/FAD-dependent oxidoreductase [Chitinophagales bacterium]|nr:NAD(P)/FAD-dependent oxidoreductase [Chitinophagales bacterium]
MSQKHLPTVCIVGGGAAGFFTAVNIAENCRQVKVIILEQNKTVLNKVKISGGGRCNVTHACFEPKELVNFYPRGKKELLGAFYTFQASDTVQWFENRGVELKTESDNRIFPISNKSETIINCLIEVAKSKGVEIWNSTKVVELEKQDEKWVLLTSKDQSVIADIVVMTTGGSPFIWNVLEKWHEIVEPVPSLFTFNIQHKILEDLQGVSVRNAEVSLCHHKLKTTGPLLITHWGLSGPAVLKMSAWGARLFHANNYRFEISINWTGKSKQEVMDFLQRQRRQSAGKTVMSQHLFEIPTRLWKSVVGYIGIDTSMTWGSLENYHLEKLRQILCECRLKVNGKSTFKEEFVTAGGVELKEVDFRTMESKKVENLFFAGEVLDIDALTGGFNFQAAWTTAYIAAQTIIDKCTYSFRVK